MIAEVNEEISTHFENKNNFDNIINNNSIGISNNEKITLKKIILKAKYLDSIYEFEKELNIYKKLSEILPSNLKIRIQKKINELEGKLNSTINNDGFYFNSQELNYILPGGFQLSKIIYQNLSSYQKDGIKWIYSIYHENKSGCILADDKELDKEIQIINLIYGLYNSMKAEKFLLIVPLEKLKFWENKIKNNLQSYIPICVFNSKTKNRQEIIRHINETSGILITTYDMMTHNHNTLLISWDFIICDDGCKKINNYKTKRYQAISKIQTKFKILLSDIPLPNKFYDIYSIFNYLLKSSNECFGTYDEFKTKFITKELCLKSEKSNSKFSKNGNVPNELLQSYIKYFVLRREKKDFYTEEYQDESEYSEICDDDEDDYKDLDNFIVDDNVYIEDNDIDENDEKYKNINWKEEYYKLNSDLSSEEEININKELIELKLNNENFINSLSNDYESFKRKPHNYQNTKIFKNYSKESSIKIKNDEITNNINISSDEMSYTHNKSEKTDNNLIKCQYCNNNIVTENDACISCSRCNKWEHIKCSGIPYDKDNLENFPDIVEYYCHYCRKIVNKNYYYALDNNNESLIYDESLNPELIKEKDYITKNLLIEDTYDRVLSNEATEQYDNIQMKSYNNVLNDENNNIMNITGKFGMETSINNFSTIIKTSSLEDISFNINDDNDKNLSNEKIINENQEKYKNYIKEFKFYFNENDKENALNSLLKANKLNSNDLNLHWWILKLIIDLKMIE